MANTVRARIAKDEEGKIISGFAEPNMVREDIPQKPIVPAYTNNPALANTSVPNAPGSRYEFVSDQDFEQGGKYNTSMNESYTAPIPVSPEGGGSGYIMNNDPAMQGIIKIIAGDAIKQKYQKKLEDLYTEYDAGKAPDIETLPEPPSMQMSTVPQNPTAVTALQPLSSTSPTQAASTSGRIGMVMYEDRERFRNQVIQNQLGGIDPYTIEPSKGMEEWISENKDELFESMTGLAKEFQDKLPAKAAEIWNKALITQASAVKKKAEEYRANGIKRLEDMMSRFDIKAKEEKANWEKASQPPKEEYRVNTAGKNTLHKWDPNSQTWIDMGTEKPQPSTITAGERLKYTKLENEIINPVDESGDPMRDPDEPVSAANLKLLNDQRAILQLPPLIEKKVKKDGEDIYEYIEQTTAKSETTKKSPASDIYNDEQLTVLLRNPRVYLGADGYYYINNAQGQPLRIKPKTGKNEKK